MLKFKFFKKMLKFKFLKKMLKFKFFKFSAGKNLRRPAGICNFF